MNKLIRILLYITIFLTLDFSITNLLFKKTNFWSQIEKIYFVKKNWRIKSDLYHHDFKKNVDVIESWGHLKYRLITNSLAFRDFGKNEIKLKNSKKERIYMIGDSFIEGVGYEYKDTVAGLINNEFSSKYEILNASVVSYSPSIYYTKTNYFIERGLKFDHCFIFLDISDIADENFIEEDATGNIYDIRQKKKETSIKGKVYSFFRIYRDYFTSGRFFYVIRELTGNYKSNLKKRYLASKKFGKSFFTISQEDINLYKSTHIDRSMWTFDEKYSKKWKSNGLKKSKKYLNQLFILLNKNNIKSHLVIYPNPAQILLNHENVHEKYWLNWATKNNISIVNLYKYFNFNEKEETIKKYFIAGDVHWNKEGNLLIFNSLKKEILDNF